MLKPVLPLMFVAAVFLSVGCGKSVDGLGGQRLAQQESPDGGGIPGGAGPGSGGAIPTPTPTVAPSPTPTATPAPTPSGDECPNDRACRHECKDSCKRTCQREGGNPCKPACKQACKRDGKGSCKRSCQQEDLYRKVKCGDVLTSSVILTEDLDCTGHKGHALTLQGDDLFLHGNGRKIHAPDASAVLWVSGRRNQVYDLTASACRGRDDGHGIVAYDAPDVTLVKNTLRGCAWGIYLSEGGRYLGRPRVLFNDLRDSKAAAFRIRAGDRLDDLELRRNDFSGSRYAIHSSARLLRLTRSQRNRYRDITHAVHAVGRDLEIRGVDFSGARGLAVFAYRMENVTLRNVDVSLPEGATPVGENVGLHFGAVKRVTLDGVRVRGRQIGLTHYPFDIAGAELTVRNSDFRGRAGDSIGMLIRGPGPYGTVRIEDNRVRRFGKGLYLDSVFPDLTIEGNEYEANGLDVRAP